jgi:hypothetical protein
MSYLFLNFHNLEYKVFMSIRSFLASDPGDTGDTDDIDEGTEIPDTYDGADDESEDNPIDY